MTDRELLEAAARAAGINWDKRIDSWNPLTDDGDALRLAVKMNFTSVFHPVLNQAIVRQYHERSREWVENVEDHPDPYAATRRAIVRAAAACAPEAKR